jgi:hypothetical protein
MGSFPGVFIFQIAALPIVLVIFLVASLLPIVAAPDSAIAIGVALAAALLLFLLCTTASVYGFAFGWRAANALSNGVSLREFCRCDPICRHVVRYIERRNERSNDANNDIAPRTEKPS